MYVYVYIYIYICIYIYIHTYIYIYIYYYSIAGGPSRGPRRGGTAPAACAWRGPLLYVFD